MGVNMIKVLYMHENKIMKPVKKCLKVGRKSNKIGEFDPSAIYAYMENHNETSSLQLRDTNKKRNN
jgi:hypothetical protein